MLLVIGVIGFPLVFETRPRPVPVDIPIEIPRQDSVAPLAISTLRGQFADNAEWRDDPARPAIITGTVDMIGSRLLFSGYAVGSSRGRCMPDCWRRMP